MHYLTESFNLFLHSSLAALDDGYIGVVADRLMRGIQKEPWLALFFLLDGRLFKHVERTQKRKEGFFESVERGTAAYATYTVVRALCAVGLSTEDYRVLSDFLVSPMSYPRGIARTARTARRAGRARSEFDKTTVEARMHCWKLLVESVNTREAAMFMWRALGKNTRLFKATLLSSRRFLESRFPGIVADAADEKLLEAVIEEEEKEESKASTLSVGSADNEALQAQLTASTPPSDGNVMVSRSRTVSDGDENASSSPRASLTLQHEANVMVSRSRTVGERSRSGSFAATVIEEEEDNNEDDGLTM